MNDVKTLPLNITYIGFREVGESYHIQDHIQNEIQWFYILRGGIDFTIDGKRFLLEANDSILIPPGLIRSPKFYKPELAYLCLQVIYPKFNYKKIALKQINLPAQLLPTVKILIREVNSPSSGNSFFYQHTLLLNILHELVYSSTSQEKNTIPVIAKNNAEKVTSRILTFMRTNLHRPLSREDFSNLVNLSVSQTSRLFSAQTGKSLITALTELRIEQAQLLLATSTLTVTQIMYDVGFNSISHFNHSFKKYVGLSPSEFRNRKKSPSDK